MKAFTKSALEESLSKLNDALGLEGSDAIEIAVCGGCALLVADVVTRPTRDVDVIAIIEPDGAESNAKPLPEVLRAAVQRVARDTGLPNEWLNSGPADMQRWGLPPGWKDRAEVREYGDYLTVHYFAREDLIPLKLYAVVDSGSGKHLDDFRALKPTEDEVLQASMWCRTQDPSIGFLQMLRLVLGQLGYQDALERL